MSAPVDAPPPPSRPPDAWRESEEALLLAALWTARVLDGGKLYDAIESLCPHYRISKADLFSRLESILAGKVALRTSRPLELNDDDRQLVLRECHRRNPSVRIISLDRLSMDNLPPKRKKRKRKDHDHQHQQQQQQPPSEMHGGDNEAADELAGGALPNAPLAAGGQPSEGPVGTKKGGREGEGGAEGVRESGCIGEGPVAVISVDGRKEEPQEDTGEVGGDEPMPDKAASAGGNDPSPSVVRNVSTSEGLPPAGHTADALLADNKATEPKPKQKAVKRRAAVKQGVRSARKKATTSDSPLPLPRTRSPSRKAKPARRALVCDDQPTPTKRRQSKDERPHPQPPPAAPCTAPRRSVRQAARSYRKRRVEADSEPQSGGKGGDESVDELMGQGFSAFFLPPPLDGGLGFIDEAPPHMHTHTHMVDDAEDDTIPPFVVRDARTGRMYVSRFHNLIADSSSSRSPYVGRPFPPVPPRNRAIALQALREASMARLRDRLIREKQRAQRGGRRATRERGRDRVAGRHTHHEADVPDAAAVFEADHFVGRLPANFEEIKRQRQGGPEAAAAAGGGSASTGYVAMPDVSFPPSLHPLPAAGGSSMSVLDAMADLRGGLPGQGVRASEVFEQVINSSSADSSSSSSSDSSSGEGSGEESDDDLTQKELSCPYRHSRGPPHTKHRPPMPFRGHGGGHANMAPRVPPMATIDGRVLIRNVTATDRLTSVTTDDTSVVRCAEHNTYG
ncbi:unnamed protein product [Vitrella brassicaformis CCMP3155]|uniref:Uncharacterized protein n=3 Tax=Vitrella brassicaformis TaxID=1169539 RepID=A0A0G4EJJ8_VITBC|nr:unnamed protein product [Vitrella brassicaformis CCMP3155]|eukprot:CEL96677.1 unnamed protein product [Vitrella brassicaformis CCMP3155]